jgi:outer membrane receptor protein involved in Fe transport
MKQLLLVFAMVFSSLVANAQITGKVVDASNGDPLSGATVVVKGTQTGVTTGLDGTFTLNVEDGTVLTVSFIGYITLDVNGGYSLIQLRVSNQSLDEIIVSSNIIDVARVRETPVAVSTISPVEITQKVGNQEFPEIMARTPGVYATKQGGGYGDSRISLRGFDQRNTSFLINGQPVNDMENGWVYWSNWQGLTDVASGIQIQRGLGASRLAVPSVGGTVSIFTKAADLEQGGGVSQLIGNDGYTKSTLSYSSGLNESGWATSLLYSYWAGDGYVYGTSGEGHTYFAAVGYSPFGSKHSLNLSILGAGQWHHQRDSWVSIRDYQNFGEDGIDRRWNTDAGYLNGEEFNMRRNFYNKPLATLNWDYDITENIKLATSLYASAGRGGGTGARGNNFRNVDIDMYPFNIDLTEHYLNRGRGTRDVNGFIDFNKVVEVNRGTTSPYSGTLPFSGLLIGSNGFRNDGVNRSVLIRRASMNSHDWYGVISNLEGQFGDFKTSIGIDLRDYTGYHYRVVTDLMGLDGYFSTGNRNSAGQVIETLINPSPFNDTGLNGPKIDYYNIGYVGWQGLNGLVEYAKNRYTVVLQGGLSNQSFQREDLFDQPGLPLSEKVNQGGGYVKGGANYNFTERQNVFFNTGFISRQPNFDAVFPNFANLVNPDLQNEEITSVELGYGYFGSNFTLNVNAYSTVWGNRFISRSFTIDGGETGTAQFRDVDVRHNGVEVETTYQPVNVLKLKGMVSIGDWKYTKDFASALFDENNVQIGTGTLYTKDAKVGDAAQFTTYLEADVRVSRNFNVDLSHRYVDGLYADYSITASDFLTPNNKGALELPSYGLVDFGATYKFLLFNREAALRVNVNNVFDTVYIAESNTNLHVTDTSTTWNGVDVRNSVWFGFGRTWNASLKYSF